MTKATKEIKKEIDKFEKQLKDLLNLSKTIDYRRYPKRIYKFGKNRAELVKAAKVYLHNLKSALRKEGEK
jgi:uncharacterized protein YicC (UPF0701 family)